jgi:hypothetical protein
MSLLARKHGFTVITFKPNNNPLTEESCFASPRESMTSTFVSESNAACFFDHQGTVHYEFTPEGQTINQDFHLAVLRCLWDAVQRK